LRDQSGNREGMNAAEMVNKIALISEMSVSTCWSIDIRDKVGGIIIDAHEVVISLTTR